MMNIKNVKNDDLSALIVVAIMLFSLYILYLLIDVWLRGVMISHGVNVHKLVYEIPIVIIWLKEVFMILKKCGKY